MRLIGKKWRHSESLCRSGQKYIKHDMTFFSYELVPIRKKKKQRFFSQDEWWQEFDFTEIVGKMPWEVTSVKTLLWEMSNNLGVSGERKAVMGQRCMEGWSKKKILRQRILRACDSWFSGNFSTFLRLLLIRMDPYWIWQAKRISWKMQLDKVTDLIV